LLQTKHAAGYIGERDGILNKKVAACVGSVSLAFIITESGDAPRFKAASYWDGLWR